MTNTGIEYEKFVRDLIQTIIDSEEFGKQKNIRVEQNVKLKDRNGLDRQFDIYWEYELGGFIYKNIIECKDYSKDISIDKVDALIGKTIDIPEITGKIIATKKGYQKGAEVKSNAHNINLLIAREQNDSDWISPEGVPLLKKIELNMHLTYPPEITFFKVILNKVWIQNNTDLSVENIDGFHVYTEDTYIEDIEKNEKYSLQDLNNRLKISNDELKEIEECVKFNNAYLITTKYPKLKLDGYIIKYKQRATSNVKTIIDGTKMLKGVVEYISNGEKRKIFNNGIVHKEKKPIK